MSSKIKVKFIFTHIFTEKNNCHQENNTKEILKGVIRGEENDPRWNHRNEGKNENKKGQICR